LSTDTPTELKDVALVICQSFDDGLSFNQVGLPLMNGGATSHEAAVEIFGAIGAYCPWHQNVLDH
jgi:hypothetical protein